MAVTQCKTFVPIQYLIFGQMLVLYPLAMIRNLAKLSTTALIADGFILVGLVYIASNEFAVIAERGIAEIAWWNKKDFPLLIGMSSRAPKPIRLLKSIQVRRCFRLRELDWFVLLSLNRHLLTHHHSGYPHH